MNNNIKLKSRWEIRWKSGAVPQLYGEQHHGTSLTKTGCCEELSQSAVCFLSFYVNLRDTSLNT